AGGGRIRPYPRRGSGTRAPEIATFPDQLRAMATPRGPRRGRFHRSRGVRRSRAGTTYRVAGVRASRDDASGVRLRRLCRARGRPRAATAAEELADGV